MTTATPTTVREEGGRLVCQWCGTSVPAQTADWWDRKPQCRDAIRCQRRIPRHTA